MRPRSRTRAKGQAQQGRRRQRQQQRQCSSSFGGLYFVIICTWCLSVIFRQQRGIHIHIPAMMRTAFLPQVQQQQQVEVKELFFFNQRRQQQNNCTNNNTTTATRTTTRTRTRTSSRIPFNIRTDLKLRPFLGSDNNTSLPYTTHRCVRGKGIRDPMGDYLHWQRRTCLYENLYYHPATETFHYYDSSSSQVSSSSSTGSTVDAAFRVADATTTASGYIVAEKAKQVGKRHFAVSKVRMGNFVRFRPLPLDDVREAFGNGSAAAQVAVVETPDDAVFVLYKPSYDSNFGHYIFDTVLSIYTMLDFFGYHHIPRSRGSDNVHNCTATAGRPYQHIPVHLEQQHHGEHNDPFYRCRKNVKSGRWPECAKMLRRVMVGLLGIRPEVRNVTSTAATGEQEAEVDVDIPRTGNIFGAAHDPELNRNHLVDLPPGAEMVLLPAVIAGPGRLAAVACASDCVLHRASQMARFRAWMFQHVFEDAALGLEMSRQLPVSDDDDGGGILTVSLAVGNSHEPAALCDFRESIAPALERHFGNRQHRVAVVDMATLTLQQQAVLVASSAIYVTNQGGGGASSLFLSRGSTALLFYNSTYGKFPLEANLYGTVGGYMNAEWLDTNEYCVAAAGTGASGGSNNQHEQSVRKFVDLVEDLLASNRIQQQQHRHCQQHGRTADSRGRKLMQTILDGIT